MTLVNIISVFCSMTAKEQITYEVPKVASRHYVMNQINKEEKLVGVINFQFK